ncbi:hypothetical protein [uncultured Parabacteroides sp.]|uniref:hypothetical protein n=1 Tax=uncultured Parabacteroides sp. TaxID=512312 RepID=UPI0025CD606F|nr:hypothetical protein [uncultured Parabacteroides sp.]
MTREHKTRRKLIGAWRASKKTREKFPARRTQARKKGKRPRRAARERENRKKQAGMRHAGKISGENK